jgi:hypothetical protein
MLLDPQCAAGVSECPNKVLLERMGGESRPQSCEGCLAPIVRALRQAGIRTVASCCGHHGQPPEIMLADGTELLLIEDREWTDHRERWLQREIRRCGDELRTD